MATLTFVYSDSTAVVGPLATVSEPHSWDLCVMHAGRITAPRGWELVRHAGPLPSHPDDDDLVALADAVREGRDGPGVAAAVVPGFTTGFTDPVTGAHGGALMAPPARGPTRTAAVAGTCGCCPTPPTDRPVRRNRIPRGVHVDFCAWNPIPAQVGGVEGGRRLG